MPTLQFPTQEDRNNIHQIISIFAQNKCSRTDMNSWIAAIVGKYGITKMPIQNYSVRIFYHKGIVPVVHFEGAQMSENCPVCESGEEDARYLRTEKENLDLDYDVVNVTCLRCGCVYATKGKNHRVNSKREVR